MGRGDHTPWDGGCELITDPQDVELLERLVEGPLELFMERLARDARRGQVPQAGGQLRGRSFSSERFPNEATVFGLRHPTSPLLAYSDAPGRKF